MSRGVFDERTTLDNIMFKEFLLDLLFPKTCISCGREGSYLCQDCQAMLEISQYQYCLCQKPVRMLRRGKCRRCRSKKLNGLYFALPYQSPLIKKLIQQFKYQPYLKAISKTLASLIITHFQLLDNKPDFSSFILIPMPLDKKRLRGRGFNQAEEIGKELSGFLKILLINDVLLKIKETLPQVELSEEERRENIKRVFLIKNKELIKNKKILLVDDIYTTGSTLEEGARVLKETGAKEVWGIVVARG